MFEGSGAAPLELLSEGCSRSLHYWIGYTQRPSVHGTPPQQSASTMQVWP